MKSALCEVQAERTFGIWYGSAAQCKAGLSGQRGMRPGHCIVEL